MMNKILLIWLYYNNYYNRQRQQQQVVETPAANNYRPRPSGNILQHNYGKVDEDYLIQDRPGSFWSEGGNSDPVVEEYLIEGEGVETETEEASNLSSQPESQPMTGGMGGIGGMPGGLGPATTMANPELSTAIHSLVPSLNNQLNTDAETFQLISYKSQVVAGINYFCKLRVGYTETFIHARIFRNFSGDYSLEGVQRGHLIDDEIAYF